MTTKRGRPRNTKAEQAILAASYDLLLEAGFGSVTVDKIAEKAQVSKATIYKWWPNKAAVVMDGYMHAAAARLPVPDTGSVFQDIVIHATNLARFLTSREGNVIKELLGEGQFDPGLAEAYRERYFKPRRVEAQQLISSGMERGELAATLDSGLAVDLLYGPLFYRLLVTGEPLDEEAVERLVSTVFEGLQA
jgi:AcrR family transcriptional regulator